MALLTKARVDNVVSQREKDNLIIACQAAQEGIVLLKNDGALPFSGRRIALYGAGASLTVKGGTGSGEVNERHSVSVLEGLRDRGFEITTQSWLEDYDRQYREAEAAHKASKRINVFKLNKIMEMLFEGFAAPSGRAITHEDVQASGTDACIYVLRRQAGEGGDRRAQKGDLFLTDEEREHIRFCAEHYGRFVLAINCGSSIDMSFAQEIPGINAILYMCQLGTEGGHAFADVISGAVSPSGKLSDTWAKRYEDIPFANEYSYLNGNLKEEVYREGIYVGYRYFDSFGIEPAYPFGFGLSYTTFEIKPLCVSAEGTRISVKAQVLNTGERYSGMEVAQLYVSAPQSALGREFQSLAAFSKTNVLAPGEKQELTLTFDLTRHALYRQSDASYVLEQGEYLLRLGNSSRHTQLAGAAVLGEEVVISRHEHICPTQTEIDELCAPQRGREETGNIPRVMLDAKAFRTEQISYDAPKGVSHERAKAFVDALTLEEMAHIVVGIGMFGGEKRFNLPGAVGNTTSRFWDRGLANVALCDGPAGLRIQKRSTVDKKGRIKPVEMAMSALEALPSFVKRFMVGDPEKNTVLYQYTTAFPASNALAQTWNSALMERVGRAIQREMKEYGCTYWLAPAINIHRNPLCGRNFEYFSEDPVLGGTLAAALTRGVQCEEGFYVTIKHFCCNNQEDNRNFVSSNVSERALREIYLRGFEIAVRDGGAKGVMTAYNRVNGVYCPNSYDLCTKVLRDEWGFDGVVMTDWFSTNNGQADNAEAIRAGNDLIMPGGASFRKAIIRGVKAGRISEEDVRLCCMRIVAAIMDSATQKEYIP